MSPHDDPDVIAGEGAEVAPPAAAHRAAVQQQFSTQTAQSWAASMARMDFREPSLVVGALEASLHGAVIEGTLLDAGCGTGLCGPLVRPLCRRLEGMDLSQNMLNAAAESGYYDALHCDDAITFLKAHSHYDAVIASGMCVFIWHLDALFEAVRSALSPNGLFVFTFDIHDGPENVIVSPRAQTMVLHNPGYVLNAVSDNGLRLLRFERCRMRNDFFELRPIEGAVVVVASPAT